MIFKEGESIYQLSFYFVRSVTSPFFASFGCLDPVEVSDKPFESIPIDLTKEEAHLFNEYDLERFVSSNDVDVIPRYGSDDNIINHRYNIQSDDIYFSNMENAFEGGYGYITDVDLLGVKVDIPIIYIRLEQG